MVLWSQRITYWQELVRSVAVLSEEKEKITVQIKYGNVEQTFSGNINAVWVGVNRFFSEAIPTFDAVRKVSLTVDLAELIEDFRGVIAIAPEGPELLMPKEKLTDSETLKFFLMTAYIGYRLGKLSQETMTKEELQTKLGKTSKTTSARLSELVKEGNVIKTEEGNYKITTRAIKELQQEILPKIRDARVAKSA